LVVIRLVATRSHERSFEGIHSLGFASYVARIRYLLCNAESRAVIISPFVDRDGVRLLREAWDLKKNTGAKWFVYTRDLPPQVLKVLLARPWGVYQYSSGENAEGNFGTHAKVYIIDDAVAIVGSLNLIHSSMYSTLEVGLETDDPIIVRSLCKLEMMLRRASRRVSD
jgi:phosphatidylserine/phosphatidylglycerophosphate/cardiolipin synthase-like enzyme